MGQKIFNSTNKLTSHQFVQNKFIQNEFVQEFVANIITQIKKGY